MKTRSATVGPRRLPTVDEVDNLLPQTQCGQCGYPGCRPYAQAMLDEGADINRCPPGGALTLQALAALLERPVLPLDPGCGETKPPQVVEIEEAACIGCTKCIQACPVDAIVGAAKRMHTVIAAECTGCELCIPPCPVDCIVIKPLPLAVADMTAGSRLRLAMERRARYQARQRRLNLPSSLSDGGGNPAIPPAKMIAPPCRPRSRPPSRAFVLNGGKRPSSAPIPAEGAAVQGGASMSCPGFQPRAMPVDPAISDRFFPPPPPAPSATRSAA